MIIINELESIIKKYFSKDSKAIAYSAVDEKEFNEVIHNMQQFERPDIIAVLDDKIIAIEHFEFDSFKHTKKGSDYRFQEFILQHQFENKVQENISNSKDIMSSSEIKGTTTLKQYYDNFKKNLESHIESIPEYEENIKNYDEKFKNKEIEYWFFIEDVSPLGSYYYRKTNSSLSLLLPFSKDIIDFLKKHKELKRIILGIYAMDEYKLVIMNNDDKTLNEMMNNKYFDVDESEFQVITPNIIDFALIVPKEELKEVDKNE